MEQVTKQTEVGAPPTARRFNYGTNLFPEDGAFIRRLLVTVAVLGLAYFIWNIADILLLLFAAVLLATLLRTFADLIRRWASVPPPWDLTLAVAFCAALLIGLMFLFGTQIAGQLTYVIEKIPAALDAAGERIGVHNASAEFEQTLTGDRNQSVLSRAAALGFTAVGAVTDLALVIIAAIYLAADPTVYRRGTAKLFPSGDHAGIFDAMDTTGNALRMWYRGQILTMLIVGVASGLAYWWIGLPSPLALGTIAAATNFVPYFGPIVGAIPPLVFAFGMDGDTLLWTLGATLLIQQIEGNILTPIIQQRSVLIPPVLILFAIVVFGFMFGLAGILLAVPLTVAITVLVKKLWVRETLGERTEIPGEDAKPPIT